MHNANKVVPSRYPLVPGDATRLTSWVDMRSSSVKCWYAIPHAAHTSPYASRPITLACSQNQLGWSVSPRMSRGTRIPSGKNSIVASAPQIECAKRICWCVICVAVGWDDDMVAVWKRA